MSDIQHPVIAIVGRPNVGKSTLFNRLLGRRKAVVGPMRGTTRDRLYGAGEWRGVSFTLVDTGGFELVRQEGLAAAVQAHIRRALEEADGFLLTCDAQAGLVPSDEMILERLRKMGKPIMLVANKADHRLAVPPEFFSLGVAEAYATSALHGRGTGDLLDQLVKRFSGPPTLQVASAPQASTEHGGRRPIAVAIVGRQNVGKSSLLNALLREDRVIVSDVPGTTRDAVDTCLSVRGESVALIDTAGLRHRRKVRELIDHASMARSLEAIARCDVALVVLDATQGVTRDDQRIITRICDIGCGCVLLVNKWDLVERGNERTLAEAIHRAAPSARFAPVLAVSAKTGFHVARSLEAAVRVARSLQRGRSDAACRAVLEEAWRAQPPPRFRGRVIRLQHVRWLPGRPAQVELTTTPVAWLPRSYEHYLLKQLHVHPPLSGIPIALVVRESRKVSMAGPPSTVHNRRSTEMLLRNISSTSRRARALEAAGWGHGREPVGACLVAEGV